MECKPVGRSHSGKASIEVIFGLNDVLSERECVILKKLIERAYHEDLSDIGKELNVTDERIKQILAKIHKRINTEPADEGKRYISYEPFDKKTHRAKYDIIEAMWHTDTDSEYAKWANQMTGMYEYLSGQEPEIIDDRYFMMPNGKAVDMLDLYTQREKIYEYKAIITFNYKEEE